MTPELQAAYDALHASFLRAKLRLPWAGADLQTLRNTLLRPAIDLSPWPETAFEVNFTDGDKTRCFYHEPAHGPRRRGGCAMLIHGLGGDASGSAIAYLAKTLLEDGWPVARINLRGAPMVSGLASGISHAGKTEDLRDIFAGLESALGPQQWQAVGISLGGNMLAKALGDGALEAFDIDAAMTICAPIDMAACSKQILKPRNVIYERHLRADLKAAVTQSRMPAQWKDTARTVTSVYDFDDRVTGPFHGFGGAEAYYAAASAGPYLNRIKVPTLLLTARSDPWIPAEGYEHFQRTASPAAKVLIARHGGHVGFHFKGSPVPAYCDAAARWFRAAAN